MENQKIIAEGSGAVTTSALLSEKYKPKENENVLCTISGGNIDVNTLNRIIAIGFAKSGRRYSFETDIQDKPGGLAELSKIISSFDANIIVANLSSIGNLGRLNAKMTLETFNNEHIEKIKKSIKPSITRNSLLTVSRDYLGKE